MTTISRFLIVLGLAAVLVPASFGQNSKTKAKAIDMPLLVELHNKVRAEEKLPPLTRDSRLDAAAQVQAKDMGDHSMMSHTGTDDSTPSERIERQGFKFRLAGENVAAGQRSSREAMTSWLNSPPHKANILGDFTQIGAACFVNEKGDAYWCVTFGKAWRKVDPKKDTVSVVEILNQERVKAGVEPLKVNPKLETAAMSHAQAMAAKEKLVKTDEGGKTPVELAIAEGYEYSRLSSTATVGQADPAEVVKSWLEAPANRKILLGEEQEVGVGLAASKDGVPCWSILIGSPPAK